MASTIMVRKWFKPIRNIIVVVLLCTTSLKNVKDYGSSQRLSPFKPPTHVLLSFYINSSGPLLSTCLSSICSVSVELSKHSFLIMWIKKKSTVFFFYYNYVVFVSVYSKTSSLLTCSLLSILIVIL